MANLLLIVQLLPAIIAVMKAIEEAMPGQGAGEAKLATVRGVLEVGNEKIPELWPQITKVIGVLVTMFNKTGWGKATPAGLPPV